MSPEHVKELNTLKSKISSVLRFKGNVYTYDELLQLSNVEIGDVYYVATTGAEYVYVSYSMGEYGYVNDDYDHGWIELGPIISGYAKESDLEELNVQLEAKLEEEDLKDATVAYAQDLVGRNVSNSEMFTFQPSAGDMSIKDDSAYIKKIKGNSVVWNQLCDFANGIFYFGSASGVKDADGYAITISDWSNNTIFQFSKPLQFNSHIWLALATVESPIQVNIKGMSTQGFVANTKCTIYAIYKSDNNNWYWGLTAVNEGTTAKIKVYGYELYDLTKMFGAGNEPTTVEEFYARIPSGIDIKAYNEGEIINLNTDSIFTIGLNQWDEQWELGIFDKDTGEPSSSSSVICCVNEIKVFANTEYYCCLPFVENVYLTVLFYDRLGNYIGHTTATNSVFITPKDCAYMKFYCSEEYGTTYNNDICINLSHTGYKNGTYEPYKEFTRELPVIKKYFPDGMKKAGSAFDSIE